MKKPFVLHPFLFAIYPILFFYTHNIFLRINPYQITISMALSLLFTAILFVSLNFIIKNRAKAGLITSAIVLLFYSSGHFQNVVQDYGITYFKEGFSFGYKKTMLLLASLLVLVSAWVMKTRRDLHGFTKIINFMAIVLIMMSLSKILAFEFKTRTVRHKDKKVAEDEFKTTAAANKNIKRDIYYIIPDMYAGEKTLKQILHFDNQQFLDELKQRGFYVPKHSSSNYVRTLQSLAATLNMDYINHLSEIENINLVAFDILWQMMSSGKAAQFLKSKGYRYVLVGGGVFIRKRPSFADVYLEVKDQFKGSEFKMVFVQTTLLRHFFKSEMIEDSRQNILNSFNQIKTINRIPGPKFVLLHLNVPHPPYVFGRNGEIIDQAELKMTGKIHDAKKSYIDQLVYTNKRLLETIDSILRNSAVPPIIIIQSDHGTVFSSDSIHEKIEDLPKGARMSEFFKNLSAFYLPGADAEEILYDTVTNVNTMRLIFNHYFDAGFQHLEDINYHSPQSNHYDFTDVTDRVISK